MDDPVWREDPVRADRSAAALQEQRHEHGRDHEGGDRQGDGGVLTAYGGAALGAEPGKTAPYRVLVAHDSSSVLRTS